MALLWHLLNFIYNQYIAYRSLVECKLFCLTPEPTPRMQAAFGVTREHDNTPRVNAYDQRRVVTLSADKGHFLV